jgi:hypothetical protein
MAFKHSIFSATLLLMALTVSCTTEDDGTDGKVSTSKLVDERCNMLYSCQCEGVELDTVTACRNSLNQLYDGEEEAAQQAGLEYDEACAARELDFWESVGCDWPEDEELAEASCAVGCPLWHGKVGPGEDCVQYGSRSSDCAQGLRCSGGTCQDVCGNWRLAEGATCWNPENPPTGFCVEGTYCDTQETNRCQRTPGPGEPCPANICTEGSWCNHEYLEARCDPIAAVGTPCASDEGCFSGYCVDGICQGLPQLGEPCWDECSGDLFCDGGVCTVPQGLGQSCASLPCKDGLGCVNNVCQDTAWVCTGYGFF